VSSNIVEKHLVEGIQLYAAKFFFTEVVLRIEVLSHADQLGTFLALDRKQDSLGSENLKKLFSQCFITEEIVPECLKIHDTGLDIPEINSRIKFGRSLNYFAAFGLATYLNLAILSEYPV